MANLESASASEWIELTAADKHKLQAYVARPQTFRAALVILQEAFGVNHHIRAVADRYARQGFLAIAPALFDRVSRGLEFGYDEASRPKGIQTVRSLNVDAALRDVAAALDFAASQVGREHVGVVGYCWGGSLAWLAATRLFPAAAVAYYGGNIADNAAETSRCPVMLHFGERDQHIPPAAVAKIRSLHPEIPVYTYDAPHGFNCDERAEYTPAAAELAVKRTLEFLQKELGR